MAKGWKSASKARRQLEEAADAYERWVWDVEVEWAKRGWPVDQLKRLLTEGREEDIELMLGGPPPRFVPEIMRVGVPGVREGDPDLVAVGTEETEDGVGDLGRGAGDPAASGGGVRSDGGAVTPGGGETEVGP